MCTSPAATTIVEEYRELPRNLYSLPWLHIPQCFHDGFFSNVRQLIAMVAAYRQVAAAGGLPFVVVTPGMYFEYQPNGYQISPKAGPVAFGVVFDEAHLAQYVSARSVLGQASMLTMPSQQHARSGKCEPRPRFVHARITDPVRPSTFASLYRCPTPCADDAVALGLAGGARGTALLKRQRCFEDLTKWWDGRGEAVCTATRANVTMPGGLAELLGESHGRRGCLGARVFLDAPPAFEGSSANDYAEIGAWLAEGSFGERARKDMLEGAAGLRFSALVRRAKARIAAGWGLVQAAYGEAAEVTAAEVGGGEGVAMAGSQSTAQAGSPGHRFAAMHLRRGDTWAIRGARGQASSAEMYWAAEQLLRRGVPSGCMRHGRVRHLVLSTVDNVSTLEAAHLLRQAHPQLTVHHFVGADVWQQVARELPEWSSYGWEAHELLRTAVEVQFWLDADVFIGSRSSMSEVAFLMRASQRGVHAMCQLTAQPCFRGTNCKMATDKLPSHLRKRHRAQCASDERYYAAATNQTERLECTRLQPEVLTNA